MLMTWQIILLKFSDSGSKYRVLFSSVDPLAAKKHQLSKHQMSFEVFCCHPILKAEKTTWALLFLKGVDNKNRCRLIFSIGFLVTSGSNEKNICKSKRKIHKVVECNDESWTDKNLGKMHLCGASRGHSTVGLEVAKLSEEPIRVVVSGA
jgi:hypothetical protein